MKSDLRTRIGEAAEAAYAAGSKTFITADPCKYGHYERYFGSRKCVICSREKRFINPLRTAAVLSGAMTYVPEKPCRRGHMERYALSGLCVSCEGLRAEGRSKRPGLFAAKRADRLKRSEAKALGRPTYASDAPCLHGHRERYVRDTHCAVCNRLEAKAIYHRRVQRHEASSPTIW